jgi:high-affinity Fe2+/Pb2+ permease
MISLAGLILTLIPSIIFFAGGIDHSTQNSLVLIGTFLWFVSAGFWLGGKEKVES